jgi:multidrug resistance efflux pump
MSIRRLRQRKPQEPLHNDVRRRRQTVIRLVYLGSVLLLALWLGDLFFGAFFYLRSQGRVLGEPAVVAVEFPATVRDILVHEGDRVTARQVVGVISSQSVTETLARLTAEQADRALRLGDARVRMATVNAVIDLAHTRRDVASDTRRRMESLLPRGFLSFDHRIAALESEFRSREDLARLTAEQGALVAQIAGLTEAVAEAEATLQRVRLLYDDGVLRAPIGGIVGRRLAENGMVLSPGQPLLELYDDTRFVLAFVPTGGLFAVSPGEHVIINAGLQLFTGTIATIEPVAALLPAEFQRAFTPLERQQVIRIDFEPGQAPPPLFTKVSVRSAWQWPAGVVRAFNWWR